MTKTKYFDDYAVGAQRNTSGRTITETDVVFHAGHTGDYFPYHVDAEFARETPFGQRIAHGTMTFAIGIGLTAGQINPVAFTYGYDRLRFPKPVFIGDTIHTARHHQRKAARRQAPRLRPRDRSLRSNQPTRRSRHVLRTHPRRANETGVEQGMTLQPDRALVRSMWTSL